MNKANRIDLTIRQADQETFELLCSSFCQKVYRVPFPRSVAMVEYRFFNVTDLVLGFEFLLQANRVPYDKCWGSDCCDGGAEYHRIDASGRSVVKRFNEHETCVAGQGSQAKADTNPLDSYLLRQCAVFDVLSWPEQQQILEAASS